MKKTLQPQPLMLPLPAVLVSAQYQQRRSIITLAWAGVVSSDPPRISLGIRPDRFSYDLIAKSGEFALNIPDTSMIEVVNYCGIKSGRNVDKFSDLSLTPIQGEYISSPMIKEAPLNAECKLDHLIELPGSHHLFLGEVLLIHADSTVLNDQGRIDPQKADIISFGGGAYWKIGEKAGIRGL